MELGIAKIETFLRVCAILLMILTACLVGLDSQTKVIMYLHKQVIDKDLKALTVLVYVASAAAAYNLLQLVRCFFSCSHKRNYKGSYRFLAWGIYFFDQLVVYLTFAVNSAALEHSVLVVTGADVFQWMKWCNRYTRFCFQIGGALSVGYIGCGAMAIISFISAFNLFRLYSPRRFMALKGS